MQAKEIKQFLYEDINRIYKVLESYDFHGMWENSSEELRCALPNGSNKTSVAIKITPELFAVSFSDDLNYSGDILGLLEKSSGMQFKDVMRELHYLFNLPFKSKSKSLDLLKDIRKYKKGATLDERENEKHTPSILGRYLPKQHKTMVEEAISPRILSKFNVMYDPERSRIIIPHYDWIEHDKIVGIVGRHTETDSSVLKELSIPKYWNYIKGYEKSRNLFGWNVSHEFVNKKKMLIIFESEKSVMKQATISKSECVSVSVGGHVISSVQTDFILRNTDMDTEIVIAFDKDIMENQAEQDQDNIDNVTSIPGELEEVCHKFSKFRKTSYVFDKFGILGDKDSPIDRGVKRWNYLLKHRIEV